MNSNKIVNTIFWVLITVLIFRFLRYIIIFGVRFWFISIPLAILLYFLFKKKIKKKPSPLDPDKEIKIYPERKIDDDDKTE